MRQFLLRLVLIIGLFTLVLSIILAGNYWRQTLFVKGQHSRTIVLGDSHATNGFNPFYYPSSSNFAQTAEPLIATAKKIEWIATHLEADSILLILSPNNIAGYNETKFSAGRTAKQMAKRYFSLFDYSYWTSQTDYIAAYWHWAREFIVPDLSGKYSFLGSYKVTKGKSKEGYKKVIARHFNPNLPALSESSIYAISEITKTCNQYGITLRVIEAPLLPEYRVRIPPEVQAAFDKLLLTLPVKSYTFKPNSELFFNSDHLNEEGARLFTQAISN
ncbi:MAG TPA: hypothetical protein DCM15_00815 [Cryomorphaceae bacterium]|nr:hypothetical protein [Cryomorphaceae bacterium]|tara:strand:- start:121 stop:942 length:822 start_codon:yes stop_codon:yes gene_type:complete